MKRLSPILAALTILGPSIARAEWCDPPIPPELTDMELAKEYRDEFYDEFNQYFRDASQYTACLDAERARIWEEMRLTGQRYERFLSDSKTWNRDE